jgi:hypothetical protein
VIAGYLKAFLLANWSIPKNWGAALFTIFVKGAGFSSRNPARAKKGRIGIGQWEQ